MKLTKIKKIKKEKEKVSLRLICGRAGTGKSQFCLEEIVKKQKEQQKIYMITPEQFSYTAEKKLLDKMPEGASIYAEVLTFKRMAHRMKTKVGGSTKVNLSASGKAILIDRILGEQKKKLRFLGKSDQNIEMVERQLTEFKKHNITIEAIRKVLEKVEEPYLVAKLTDMLLLYQKWEEKIENQYIDENDSLTILAEQLEQTKEFKDAYFYLDEFVGFTQQEYRIVEILLQRAKQVNITIGTDSLILDKEQESDIFYSNKETAKRLMEIAERNQITIENPVWLLEPKRFENEELKHLERNIYAVPYQIYPKEKKVEAISLFLASNAYTEIEHVAEEIEDLVRNKGYRYKDIAIITKDLGTYSHLCKAIFEKYDIPVFLDEKKQLNQNNLAQYLLAILEIFAKNWSYEAVFSYIKTGFLNLEDDEIALLENFCRKWGIKGNKWLEEWNYEEKTPQTEEKMQIIEAARKQVVIPLQKLKEAMSGQRTVESFTKQIYLFLIENGIDKQLQEREKELEEEGKIELAKEQKMAWNVIMEVLDEIVMVLASEKITFHQYSQLLKTGLKNSSLGKIPEVMDQVMVGDIDRTRTHTVKAIFMIGVNDGVFPTIYKEEGFFNDKDREYLKVQGVELAKGTLERLYEDNFAIYKAFTVASQKIYLSYPSTDSEGGALRPSMLIGRIKKIFPNLQEQSDLSEKQSKMTNQKASFETLVTKLEELKEGKEIEDIWFQIYKAFEEDEKWKDKIEAIKKAITKTNKLEPITKENSEKLYGDTLHTSVSRLEQYRSCPFSYFLQYGLNLSEKTEFKVQAVDTGSFMHEVIDTFFETVRENGYHYKDLEEQEVKEMIDTIVEEKLASPRNYIFRSNQKYQLLAMRLKRVIYTSMKYILQSLKNSDFEVYGNEVEFKKGKQYPPIELALKDGKRVEITGKIDRVDIAKTEKGEYIRIIDYKSSVKNIDLNEVMAGIQIQLLTYLDATCKEENMLPAGTLYFSLLDPIVQAEGRIEEETLNKEIAKRFRMQGFILADVEMVKKMDKTLEKGASAIVPAYLDKDGNLSMAKSNAVTKEEFEVLQKYTNGLIQQIAEEIYAGKIALEPYYNSKNKKTPCEYCPYKEICQFEPKEEGCKYRYIAKKEKQEIMQQMQKEVEKGR